MTEEKMQDLWFFSTPLARISTFIFLSFVLLYFIFAPGINVLYYGGEDLRYVTGGISKACHTDDGFGFMLTLGRTLQAYMDCASYKLAYTLERMMWLRVFAVFLMACCMGLIINLFFRRNIPFAAIFFASSLVFLTDKIYYDTVLTGAVSLPFSVLFVILAYQSMQQSYLLNKNQIKWRLLAFSLVLCAMLTYPAMAFFYGTLVLLKLLMSKLTDWKVTKRQIFLEISLFSVAAIVYFVWAYYNAHYHQLAPLPDNYSLANTNLNPIEILQRLQPLGDLFHNHPWILLPFKNSQTQVEATLFFLAGALLIALFTFIRVAACNKQFKQWTDLSQIVVAIIVVLLFSSLFYLIIPNRELMTSRILFGTTTSGLALLIWGALQWQKILPHQLNKLGLISFMVWFFFNMANGANLALAHDAASHQLLVKNTEVAVQNYLAQNTHLQRVHFIIAKGNYPYDKFMLSNAVFSQLLGRGNYALKWCSLPRGFVGEERDYFDKTQACLNQLPPNVVGITYSFVGDPYVKTKAMVVVT